MPRLSSVKDVTASDEWRSRYELLLLLNSQEEQSKFLLNDRSQLIDILHRFKKTSTHVQCKDGTQVDINDGQLKMICTCKKKYSWRYDSTIPKISYKCSCGKVLIDYMKSKKFRFISQG